MTKKNFFISIGNTCAAALALQQFDQPTLPFDWAPTTIYIVRDLFENPQKTLKKLLDFSTNLSLEYTTYSHFTPETELIDFALYDSKGFTQSLRVDSKSNTNAYSIYYPHDKNILISQLQEQIGRRIERLFEILKSSSQYENIYFVFTNENSLILESSKNNEKKYYLEILELVKYIEKKYPHLIFQILCFFPNKTFNDTPRVKNIYIGCKTLNEFREKVNQYFLENFGEKNQLK